MFTRILRSRADKQAKVRLDALFDTIRTVRTRSDFIAIVPTITGYSWLGVNRATHALFPDSVLELPHVLANSVCSDQELKEMCRYVSTQGFAQVILSGFPPCFTSVATCLRDCGVRVGAVFHGFLAECSHPLHSQPFEAILRLCRDGVIAKLACNKKGLPETIGRLTGLKVHKIMVPTRLGTVAPAGQSISRGPGECHIGVLAHDTFRKNIHNQVAAALLIEGATVHVAGHPDVHYWRRDHRLVHHPATMDHRDYVGLLGQMDVNLHLSFTESWGQLTAESLAMGVPCLIANHSDIYDYDPVLRQRLVSENFDNPYELSNEVASVIAERDALSDRCAQYVSVLNQKAEELLKNFLET